MSERKLYSPEEVSFARHVLVQMRDAPPSAVADEPPLEMAPRVNLPDAMYEQAATRGVFDMTLPLQGDQDCGTCGGQGVTPQREWCVCARDYPATPPWPEVTT